jgi:hypothetical protein
MSLLFGVTYELAAYASPLYYFATPILLLIIVAGLILWERNRVRETPPSSDAI